MASSGKKNKTTMAKLSRENKLRERRLGKQAKRDARKSQAAHLAQPEGTLDAATMEGAHTEGAQPAPEQAALDSVEEESTHRPPAHDLTTEKAIKHLFPREAAQAVRLEAKQEHQPAGGADWATG
jgi:hypothetical protein